jgi:hypothetical protein
METQMLGYYQNDVTQKYVLGGVEEDSVWSSLSSLPLSFILIPWKKKYARKETRESVGNKCMLL